MEVTEDEFKQLLSKYILIPEKDKFVDLLTGHLCKDSFVMEQVFKGMLGIHTILNYKEGEFIYVPYNYLPTWRVDEAATLALPEVVGNLIPCQIKYVDPYAESSYTVNYQAVKTGDTKPTDQEYMIRENSITGRVENVEEVLDQLEKDAEAIN
jgi:hypothetical protein